jgi:hypothetical protein
MELLRDVMNPRFESCFDGFWRVESRITPVLSDAEGNHESRIAMGDPEDDEEEEEEEKKREEEEEEENDGEEQEVPWQVAGGARRKDEG